MDEERTNNQMWMYSSFKNNGGGYHLMGGMEDGRREEIDDTSIGVYYTNL